MNNDRINAGKICVYRFRFYAWSLNNCPALFYSCSPPKNESWALDDGNRAVHRFPVAFFCGTFFGETKKVPSATCPGNSASIKLAKALAPALTPALQKGLYIGFRSPFFVVFFLAKQKKHRRRLAPATMPPLSSKKHSLPLSLPLPQAGAYFSNRSKNGTYSA